MVERRGGVVVCSRFRVEVLVFALLALVVVASARADDGWGSYGGAGLVPTPRSDRPAIVSSPRVEDFSRELAAVAGVADVAPVVGVPGPAGPAGPQGPGGPAGPQGAPGAPGVAADVCQNIPGRQSEPGFKYWAQRYWSFNPKYERRYLTLNRKRQLVCVTQRWIRRHGLPAAAGGSSRSLQSSKPFDFQARPVCQVKNPPFSPRIVPGSNIIEARIQQRCFGIVWKLGAWGCIQHRDRYGYWSNVWCEAHEVYFKTAQVLFLDANFVRKVGGIPVIAHEWRVQGYVWVDYEPGVTGFYKSQTVTSSFVPLDAFPSKDP